MKIIKCFILEIIFLPMIFLPLCFAFYTHWSFGISIFKCACIQEEGNFLQNLFAHGHINESQWWYGLGHTFWMLAQIPIIAYIVMRVPLTLLRIKKKRSEPAGAINSEAAASPR